MAQEDAMVVRSAPVAQVALGIQHVVRTIRNFFVGTRNAKCYGLTQLYDLCTSSLFQVVYPRPEELESAQVSLTAGDRRWLPRLAPSSSAAKPAITCDPDEVALWSWTSIACCVNVTNCTTAFKKKVTQSNTHT